MQKTPELAHLLEGRGNLYYNVRDITPLNKANVL